MIRLRGILRSVSLGFMLLMAATIVLHGNAVRVAFGQVPFPRPPIDATEIMPQWKFTAGDNLGVEIQSRENVVDDQGNAFKNERIFQLRWTVEAVDATGNARIVARFDRIQIHHQKPRLEYDSLNDSPLLGAVRDRQDNAQVYHYRAMANCVFYFDVNPRGGVGRFSGAESMLVPILYTPGDMVALPDHPIKVGDTWSVATASSGENFFIKGRSTYRLASLERHNGQVHCRIDGKGSISERAGLTASGAADSVSVESHFDLTAGRVASEKIVAQAKVEVAPGKLYSLASETTRRTFSLEKQVEQVPRPGLYSLDFDQGAARPVVLGGVRARDDDEPITKFLVIVMFHKWSDDNKDRQPDIEEFTDIHTRFASAEPANFVVYAIGLPDAKIQFEVVDANGVSFVKNDLPVQGRSAYILRSVRGLEPGVYFFEFFVDGQHLVRIPVQVFAKVEEPKPPRSADMVSTLR